ncbi:MAG: hypothetical protein AB7F89_00010 [Pirellulaceae bacterium]
MRSVWFGMVVTAVLFLTGRVHSQEPTWSGKVILFGEQRSQLEATPIELRPNRPLHFYGNAVRRQYYRGTTLPASRNSGASIVRGR